ncbi:MAG: bifunctional diguanylate cyclase/phosphodiesterase [Gammaproteobacteria bacterium]
MSELSTASLRTAARLLHERDALSKALLAATADLAQGQDAESILRRTCDALVAASPHILLAWMYLGDPRAEFIRPAYAAGRARGFAADFTLGNSPVEERAPTRRSLTLARPVLARIRTDPTCVPYRDAALDHGLESSISLPFGTADAAPAGVVNVYADDPEYFLRLGAEPFRAFAHLGQVALEQAELRHRLQEIATFDHLTGLPNRRAMVEALEREHARASRNGRPYSLVLFDLDHFKLINDSYGHVIGDQVLIGVARAAQSALRDGDWLGRWGGEEFLALLPETDQAEALTTAERLRGAVGSKPQHADDWTVEVTLTAGVATYPQDGQALSRLISSADANLYEAKRSGRNRVLGGGGATSDAVLPVATQLRSALQEGRLRPAYQPIVALSTVQVVAEEALARIVGTDGQVTYAGRFIEAAGQMQLIHRVDFEIVTQSVKRCMAQVRDGGARQHFVNISTELLRHPELVDQIIQMAQQDCGACVDDLGERKPLVLEITERQFLSDAMQALAALQPLLDFGMQLAIDDFGSGYSSFRYFADLPVAYLKLERHLVGRLRTEAKVRTIVEGIQATARRLGVITVAEGVEDKQTAIILQDMGVDWGQGHFFGRPQFP